MNFFDAYYLDKIDMADPTLRKAGKKKYDNDKVYGNSEGYYISFMCHEKSHDDNVEENIEEIERELGVRDVIKKYLCECADNYPFEELAGWVPSAKGFDIVVIKEKNHPCEIKVGVFVISQHESSTCYIVPASDELKESMKEYLENNLKQPLEEIWDKAVREYEIEKGGPSLE